MRFYDIKITDQTGKLVKEYTSAPGGVNNSSALNILLDIYETGFAVPSQGASIQIWGVALSEISQKTNYAGMNIAVYAGFNGPGLPLEKPKQAGLIASGYIYQCFGNWVGTDMTLDFVFYATSASQTDPANLVFQWRAGTPLATAIANTLKTAYPAYKQSINISPNLILDFDEVGYYQTPVQLAQMIKTITQNSLYVGYAGVDIVLKNNTFIVYDGTATYSPKTLAFTDLIGQPTYLQSGQINFLSPMRADITVGDYVRMPAGEPRAPGAVTTTAASQPQARQMSIFQGVFQVVQVHHVGNFRQPTGDAWVTVFDANQVAA